jgi:hypothetical protein
LLRCSSAKVAAQVLFALMEPTEMDEDVKVPAGGPAAVFGAINPRDTQAAVAAGVAAGNIFKQEANAEVLQLPEVRLCT